MLNIFFVIFVANPGKAWKQEKLGCGWKWRKMFHCLHFPGKEYGWKIERFGMWTVVNSPSFSHWHVRPPRDPHALVFTASPPCPTLRCGWNMWLPSDRWNKKCPFLIRNPKLANSPVSVKGPPSTHKSPREASVLLETRAAARWSSQMRSIGRSCLTHSNCEIINVSRLDPLCMWLCYAELDD